MLGNWPSNLKLVITVLNREGYGTFEHEWHNQQIFILACKITITEEVAKVAGVMQLPKKYGMSKLTICKIKWCKAHI